MPLACLVTLLACCRPALAQRPRLGNDEQLMVDRAIQEGRRYILAHQSQTDASFAGPAGHPVGVTALAGLALLESGARPSTPQIIGAANYVLTHWEKLFDTYDLSLAVLFLDRFAEHNEKKYKKQIQSMALRLIAGQTTTGGWSYKCASLSPSDERELLRVLRELEKIENPKGMQGVAGGPSGNVPGAGQAEENRGASSASASRTQAIASLPRPGMCIKTADDPNAGQRTAPPPGSDAAPAGGNQPAKAQTVRMGRQIAFLPVVQELHKLGMQHPLGGKIDAPVHEYPKETSVSDNSNTQFAILAMWTAGRYDVPIRRTLYLVVKRFRESQCVDGGWVYGYTRGGAADGTPAMTCAGLAGLAVGFGMSDQNIARKDDEQLVKKGFRCLMKFVGDPSDKFEKRVPLVENNNLYYLWSIERVAVMYNLPTLGNRNWYRWGVEILLGNQSTSGPNVGAWMSGGNTTLSDPVVNTSLALLFLRGANLTADLTARLPINPEELNKELAGEVTTTIRTKGAGPSKEKEKSPLGTGDTETERPIDSVQEPEKPKETTPPQQATQQQQQTPTAAPTSSTTEQKEEGKGNGLMIAIFAGVAVIVIAGAGVAIFLATRGGKKAVADDEDDKPRSKKAGRRAAREEDEEEDEAPRTRRAAPPSRAGAKGPGRTRGKEDSSSL
jgi:hypothetical protein